MTFLTLHTKKITLKLKWLKIQINRVCMYALCTRHNSVRTRQLSQSSIKKQKWDHRIASAYTLEKKHWQSVWRLEKCRIQVSLKSSGNRANWISLKTTGPIPLKFSLAAGCICKSHFWLHGTSLLQTLWIFPYTAVHIEVNGFAVFSDKVQLMFYNTDIVCLCVCIS